MLQMKAIRDEFDPHGGRASGSREMLNINEAKRDSADPAALVIVSENAAEV